MVAAAVTLPSGFAAEGSWHRQAWLRPITGEDEDHLRTADESLRPAARLTALLARCLDQLGPWRPVTPVQVRRLAAGDRDALALHLRRLTLGDRLDCVLACPACGRSMDLELSAAALLSAPYVWQAAWHPVTVGEGEAAQVLAAELQDAGVVVQLIGGAKHPEERLGPAVQVGEVAATAAGDADLLAERDGMLD